MTIEDFVCTAPPTATLSNLTTCMHQVEMPSPIDYYLKNSRELLNYGTPEQLGKMDSLGGLLLLGLISLTEGYLRSILSAALDICPVCKNTAAEKQINLGGVLWHGKDEFRRSAFEHMSFASAKEVTSATRAYLGFEMKGSKFDGILQDFDVICHLRHGLIHNAGILPGRNAVQINIKSYEKPVEIRIDYAFLQSAAATLESLVFTLNRALFAEMCNRWASSWRRHSGWIPADERKRFMQLWNIFLCKLELQNREGKSKITATNCMTKVKTSNNI